MPKRQRSEPIELPHLLKEAVKDQRAVLVFGAGASLECVDATGRRPPNGTKLRDHLAKKFLGTTDEYRDLATVAEMAIASGAGEPAVYEEIAHELSGFEPSEAHQSLANFRWRGLATTNYDTLIEQGYAKNEARRQTCLPFIKNEEPYEDRLKAETNSLALFKLHGCINHRLDKDIPLVLSNEHYHRYLENRDLLFNRLKDWASSSHLVFVGYRMADPHLRALIYDIDPKRRPQWYIVTPGTDEHDKRLWAKNSVDVIDATFGQFMSALDTQVPELFRSLAVPVDADAPPYRRHFRTHDVGSDDLRAGFEKDVEYIHSGLAFDEVVPQKFYSGHDDGWCCIVRQYDFRRKAGEKLLFAALDPQESKDQKFLLLQGSAGAGKSIALRRAAYDAATSLDQLVVWLRKTGQPKASFFEELYSLTGKRVLLFIDQVSIYTSSVLSLLQQLEERNVPITVVGAEREADWFNYSKELEEAFPPELHTLQKLSEREAEDLVDLLERHSCLGLLESRTKDERIAAFLDDDRADRQLLVALHELTRGLRFEEIILEEYERITTESAKQLYLDIATMHQFGVIARAGAISRVSGIRFSDFEEKFFLPLSDIVRVVNDPFTGDKGYEARHVRVSRILFGVACPDDDEKSRQLSRIIGGLDSGFSTDMRIVENVCKGRTVAEQFKGIESARGIFKAAAAAMPKSAFLYQQAAIMEYTHRDGSLAAAQDFAEKARELDDNNHIYIHTLAEVARRRANSESSRVAADMFRAQSRTYLNQIWLKTSRKDLTFCKLLIDESLEILKNLPEDAKDHELIEFDDKVNETTERLRKAQQDFPHEAEFPSAEGRFLQRLGESELASKAFAKAISARPRNSGAFSRLSRIQSAGGATDEAVDTLERALERFPDDKSIHLQMALHKFSLDHASALSSEFHFRSSFSIGDHNFDGRFFLGEYLFWAGKVEESKKIFDELNARAPAHYRKLAPASDDIITEKLSEYGGTVESKKDRYFHIRYGGYPAPVFAHISSLVDVPLDELQVGSSVMFKIRFNRRGPVAVAVWK